jgi:transcriptional regulator with XRE-family HTH domain
MTNTEKLGQAFASLRIKRGLTQDDIAAMLGKTQKTIWAIENGKSFTAKSLELYLEALSVEEIRLI